MLLQHKETGSLIEILDIQSLVDPTQPTVFAQDQMGQEEQDLEPFAKQNLVFPSGKSLPRCWGDADYRAQ